MEQRATYRFLSDTTVNCRVPDSPDSATISDISADGCRLRFDQGTILPGSTLLVELMPGFHAIGRVVWKNGNEAGLQFQTRIDQTLIEHVRRGDT